MKKKQNMNMIRKCRLRHNIQYILFYFILSLCCLEFFPFWFVSDRFDLVSFRWKYLETPCAKGEFDGEQEKRKRQSTKAPVIVVAKAKRGRNRVPDGNNRTSSANLNTYIHGTYKSCKISNNSNARAIHAIINIMIISAEIHRERMKKCAPLLLLLWFIFCCCCCYCRAERGYLVLILCCCCCCCFFFRLDETKILRCTSSMCSFKVPYRIP